MTVTVDEGGNRLMSVFSREESILSRVEDVVFNEDRC